MGNKQTLKMSKGINWRWKKRRHLLLSGFLRNVSNKCLLSNENLIQICLKFIPILPTFHKSEYVIFDKNNIVYFNKETPEEISKVSYIISNEFWYDGIYEFSIKILKKNNSGFGFGCISNKNKNIDHGDWILDNKKYFPSFHLYFVPKTHRDFYHGIYYNSKLYNEVSINFKNGDTFSFILQPNIKLKNGYFGNKVSFYKNNKIIFNDTLPYTTTKCKFYPCICSTDYDAPCQILLDHCLELV